MLFRTPRRSDEEMEGYEGLAPWDSADQTLRSNAKSRSTAAVKPSAAELHSGLGARTSVTTDKGSVVARQLRVGDRVLTRDAGFQNITRLEYVQTNPCQKSRNPCLSYVRLAAGSLASGSPDFDIQIGKDHAVLVRSACAEFYFGTSEVLVPAISLASKGKATTVHAPLSTELVKIFCASHQIIAVHGAWIETCREHVAQDAGRRLFEKSPTQHTYAARTVLNRFEAQLILEDTASVVQASPKT